jgi:predicted acylesterase/phospholipase RssA
VTAAGVTTAGVTLVLSGGGAKTAAHAGAARALAESGLAPARYVATSMGAVVAAALAAGTSPDDLVTRLAEVGESGVSRDPLALARGLFARSLLRPAPFRRAVERLVGVHRFADLAVPLTVTVVDLDSGALLVFGAAGEDAPLVDVLCAACALPVYFPPAELAGRRCGDGGLRGPLPLEVAARVGGELVVAVDVGPGFDVVEADSVSPGWLPPVVRAHDEAVGTLMANATAAQLALWRADPARPRLIYVRPRVERNATFRVDRVRGYAEDGYRATIDALAGVRRP